MGSYIPAQFAQFRIYHRLSTRIGSDDDLEGNASTFALEMREMASSLADVDDNTFLIVDELGRGTCTIDALAIATSICESLIESKVSGYM